MNAALQSSTTTLMGSTSSTSVESYNCLPHEFHRARRHTHSTIEDSSLEIMAKASKQRRKSASYCPSPAKMENCMFSFPIPTCGLRGRQSSYQRASPEPSLAFANGTRSRGAQLLTVPPSSPIMNTHADCPPESAKTIFINSDYRVTSARRRRTAKQKSDILGGRIFTFVADKRMTSVRSPLIDQTSISIPASPAGSDFTAYSPGKPSEKRGRRSVKRPLTFHQLEFNSSTLKPFDRSVYTVKGGDSSKSNIDDRPTNNLLVEAAEILLELQSDTESLSSVPNQLQILQSSI